MIKHFFKIIIFSSALVSNVMAEDFPTLNDKFSSRHLIENFGAPLGAAEAGSVRSVSLLALGLIKSFEGWFPDLYNDPAGYCTIGYGHLLALRKCKSSDRSEFPSALTEEQGVELLQKDTIGARRDVLRLVIGTDLNDAQFGALTSFVFNVGAGNFGSSTMLKHLNDTKLEGAVRVQLAAREFPKWIKAGGKVYNGLIARRNCEVALFTGQDVSNAVGVFSRNTCDSLGASPSTSEIIDIWEGE